MNDLASNAQAETAAEPETKGGSHYSIADFPSDTTLTLVYTKGNGEQSFSVTDVSETVRLQLATYGLNKYLGQKRKGVEGYDAIKARDLETFKDLCDGVFETSEGFAEGGRGVNDLADAAAEVSGKPREPIYQNVLAIYRATLTTKASTTEQKAAAKLARAHLAAYRKLPGIDAALARIEAKRGAKVAVDLADLTG